MNNPNHLSLPERINLGAYYTPPALVEEAFRLIRKHVPYAPSHTLLDSSCGFGSFLRGGFRRTLGGDIDPAALYAAQKTGAALFECNALGGASRRDYSLAPNEKLIIIGNPPYNDSTSHARKSLKQAPLEIHPSLKRRDMGLSFLLSYQNLEADWICVLHPLSYLIKKRNFSSLHPFTRHYCLIDGLVVSSSAFAVTSRASAFPILIALYQRGKGMGYDDIYHFRFPVQGGKPFSLSCWDSLACYAPKYPRKASFKEAAYFWTMRDINALRRNRTFLQQPHAQAIPVPLDLLPYYCYADAFKRRLNHVPYYLGNCDLPFDKPSFLNLSLHFLGEAKAFHPFLPIEPASFDSTLITRYFTQLLEPHYLP